MQLKMMEMKKSLCNTSNGGYTSTATCTYSHNLLLAAETPILSVSLCGTFLIWSGRPTKSVW